MFNFFAKTDEVKRAMYPDTGDDLFYTRHEGVLGKEDVGTFCQIKWLPTASERLAIASGGHVVVQAACKTPPYMTVVAAGPKPRPLALGMIDAMGRTLYDMNEGRPGFAPWEQAPGAVKELTHRRAVAALLLLSFWVQNPDKQLESLPKEIKKRIQEMGEEVVFGDPLIATEPDEEEEDPADFWKAEPEDSEEEGDDDDEE